MPSSIYYTGFDELQYDAYGISWDKSYLAVPKVAETYCTWDHLGWP